MISPRHPFPSGRRPAPPSASPAAITRPTAVMSPHVQWPGIAAGTPGALSPAVTPAAPLRPRATGQAMSLFPHALTARTAGDAGVFVVVVVVVVTPFTRTRLKPAPAARATGARRLSAIRAVPAGAVAPPGWSLGAGCSPGRVSAIRAVSASPPTGPPVWAPTFPMRQTVSATSRRSAKPLLLRPKRVPAIPATGLSHARRAVRRRAGAARWRLRRFRRLRHDPCRSLVRAYAHGACRSAGAELRKPRKTPEDSGRSLNRCQVFVIE